MIDLIAAIILHTAHAMPLLANRPTADCEWDDADAQQCTDYDYVLSDEPTHIQTVKGHGGSHHSHHRNHKTN